jgi:CTP synthase (UTP-ammonia lyase)
MGPSPFENPIGRRSCRGIDFSEKSTMTHAIRIGIIGDFEPAYHSHFATNAALYDAATKLNVPLMVRWIATPTLESDDSRKILSRWDGLIASPGSPYKSFTGMLRGIEFARTRDWPFTGT